MLVIRKIKKILCFIQIICNLYEKNVTKIVRNETLCNAVHIGISMLDFYPKVDSGAFSM